MQIPTKIRLLGIGIFTLLFMVSSTDVLAQKSEPVTDTRSPEPSINTTSASRNAPSPPPLYPFTTSSFSAFPGTAIPDGPGGVITEVLNVSGMGNYLFDVDLTTAITHTFAADLEITLTSPAGTVVTITTDNGGGDDDVFAATLWDDDGDNPVTDFTGFTNGVPASPLVPEEALGAFIGENPNGNWTLRIEDDAGADVGTLNSWRLNITTFPTGPTPMGPTAFIDSPALAIPDGPGGSVSTTITVGGMNAYLYDVNLTTDITHTFAADLEITLTSPAGTVVTITTDNGAGNDNVFMGTIWDDDGGTPATDAVYTNLVTASPLVPEEAMAAFISENPNGDWTLDIVDDAGGDVGTLNSWALNIIALDPTSNLPVELTSFTATAQLDGAVLLNWKTASETNNAGFEIEHAAVTNEVPKWEKLDFIAGVGTTTEAQSYSYRAEGLTPGRHLFRLKQVDFDGAFEYSPEVEAEIELPGTHELSGAYPNPFNPTTTFTLTVARQQQVRVEVFDVTGKSVGVLYDGSLSAGAQHLFRFDAVGLPGGMYLYRVVGETFSESKTMTLLK